MEVINIYPNDKYNYLINESQRQFEIKAIKEVLFFKIDTDDAGDFGADFREVLYDSIIQEIYFEEYQIPSNYNFAVEVGFKPGVTDNLANTTVEALKLKNIETKVSTGRIFFIETNEPSQNLIKFAKETLGNDLIETIHVYDMLGLKNTNRFNKVFLPEVKLQEKFEVNEINLNVSNDQLNKINQDRCLALTLKELKSIRDYYNLDVIKDSRRKSGLPINPTDLELEVLAQTWSEHCKHKIFAAEIEYTQVGDKTLSSDNVLIDGLYKTYIKKLTQTVSQEHNIDWLVSVFDDNAGIVRFDENVDLCIKVETHNSPSALDPYGGSITGILGVNRDILGCGMGAKPIANTDTFCFCEPTWPDPSSMHELPIGLKHPSKILSGVHKGIEDGGNKSGIPTINGAIYFDRSFAGKPLVFCGTVGVLPQVLSDKTPAFQKKANVHDRIVMIGGFIGADGVHGATMSSLELNENSPATAVQIGDPLTQKRMLDFIIVARDQQLFNAITDNGAGGLSSSVGEMALQSGGAVVDLAHCPVKYPGLSPYELLISESQERMTLAVPSNKFDRLQKLAKIYGVTLTDIGEFTDSGHLIVYYNNELVGKIDLEFLHHGLPKLSLRAKWEPSKLESAWSSPTNKKNIKHFDKDCLVESLKKLLGRGNIASKQSLVKHYDHEVQAATHIKPFMGKTQNGPSDSGVLWLYPHGGTLDNGVAVSCGLNPRISQYDPYLMAQYAVDEALRNVVACGGNPEMTCLLDNFCWPDPVTSLKNPDGEYKLGQLVRTCMGLYDICLEYKTPLVSGKDSMKNDFRGKTIDGNEVCISILPTLLVTAMSKVDIRYTSTSGFKNAGDIIYLIGKNVSGLLGSEFSEEYAITDHEYLTVPSIDPEQNFKLYKTLHKVIVQGLLSSCHDISDGGVIISIVESMFENNLGAQININNFENMQMFDYLYNEGPGRFIVSIPGSCQREFEKQLGDLPFTNLGFVTQNPKLLLTSNHEMVISEDTATLMSLWKREF
ncbi:MAG: hypothetical protein A2381_19550 [Bdellovibrionales bacterium RIFOXYB1_FULL_37_110]|nr:MAG: hypothetical protein A2417_11050 [Bdellovibrionales bacterium RIFOXYC1_FULL_37_79]OFZ60704.1 MAG: hypothetical protein A2381_19550 [Bdellovibrionales bacterium RIFOXYB1_FULL_37_110]OFZ64443.1 MAG: hypothetical protein A2577_10200 [Bdellovibrionales bacterium RIFOXYD1_FULL_36_51]